MIKGFDQQTQPLSEYEENVLLPVILQGLKTKQGKKNAVTNRTIVMRLSVAGYKIDEARCRKLINHIRTTDILPGLIATSGDYFLAENEAELLDYEESLLGRENAIKEVRLAMQGKDASSLRTRTSPKKGAFSNIQINDNDMKKIFLFVKNGGNETLVGRYDSKADAQEKVMDMVEEDSVSVFNFRIEEREYDITNRVKSYADACKVLGIEPMDEDSMKAQGFRPDEIARRQLETITEALNEGWKPNWADTDEYKFYPWFYIEVSEVQTEGTSGANAGLSCASTSNAATNTNASIGSRLCFHDRETARYAGRTFTDLYAQILIEKI